MSGQNFKALITELLAHEADIQIDGDRPWDLKVHNEALFDRVATAGNLGFGEAYMDGWWKSEQIDELINRIIKADIPHKISRFSPRLMAQFVKAYILPAGQARRAFEVGQRHYDLGNDLYRAMLDPRLVYSCGYWRQADTLAAAQEAKLDLICRKIQLKPGMRVLDIGGGWGSFAKFAAERYGATVVSVTVSKEQKELADTLCQGLPVENRLQDYRELNETFDAIVSVGMFEHVGPRYYRTYFEVAERCLANEGIFLLHTIGHNISSRHKDPWIGRYIFPNSVLPSAKQITTAIEGRFIIEDWHNFGADYDRTLMAWHANFERHWPQLKNNYDERFYRMWRYYLLSCAGGFRARSLQLWQVVLSKHGVAGGYESVR